MNSKLKPLRIIHLGLCAGIFLFAVVTIIISKDQLIFETSFETTLPFNPIFPIIGVSTAVLSMALFKNMVSKIDKSLSLDPKLMQYQSAFIVSAAMLEGGALINIVGFMITGNVFFLVFALFSLFLLIRIRPTKDKLVRDLQLQYPETEQL